MPMNDTLIRSPNDDRSIQNTEKESNTITNSGQGDQAADVKRLPLRLDARNERRPDDPTSGVGRGAVPDRQGDSQDCPLRYANLAAGRPRGLRFHLQPDLIVVKAQHFENGFQLLLVKGEAPQIEVGLGNRAYLFNQSQGAVRPHAENHPLLVIGTGAIDEDDLREPARGDLIDLIGTLVDFLVHSHRRFEGLSFVMPLERQHARESERLGLVVNFSNLIDFQVGFNRYRTVTLGRPEDKGSATGRLMSLTIGFSNGLGSSHPRVAHNG